MRTKRRTEPPLGGPLARPQAGAAVQQGKLRADALRTEVPKALFEFTLPVQNLITRFVSSSGFVDPTVLGSLVGVGELLAAQLAPVVKWTGASLALAKSTWASAAIVELGAAKTLDYQLTKRLRRPGGAGTKLYTAMARAGLEAGWKNDGTTLPWWYGAISYGATGCIDFMVAQALGHQLRSQFEAHPEVQALRAAGSAENEERLSKLEQAFFARGMKALATRLTDPNGGAQSPLTRHLLAAMREQHDPELVRAVERRLETKKPGDPAVGTMAGHGATGGAVGTMMGDPLLGLLVGVADSSADAVMTKAALKGRFQTLAKVKAGLLKQGWDGEDGRSAASIVSDFYAPVGAEFRALGRDLRVMAEHGADALSKSPSPELEAWLDEQLGTTGRPREATTSAQAWFEDAIGSAFGQVSEHLAHHASLPMREALGSDFPEVAKRLARSMKYTKAAIFTRLLDGETVREGATRPFKDGGSAIAQLSDAQIENRRSKLIADSRPSSAERGQGAPRPTPGSELRRGR